jgi:predicted CXXCH cytochrome family protein
VTDHALYEIDVVVNGEETYQAYVRDFLFSVEVDLAPGENRIRIGEETLDVFFASEGETAPAEYRPVYGHIGLDDGCAECHEGSDEGKFSFEESPDEVCGWCHGDLVRGSGGEDLASVHGPVKAGKCLLCHTPHLSDKPGLLAEKVSECRECHRQTFERLETERYVHGPLNLGDCRLCHTIHSSMWAVPFSAFIGQPQDDAGAGGTALPKVPPEEGAKLPREEGFFHLRLPEVPRPSPAHHASPDNREQPVPLPPVPRVQ